MPGALLIAALLVIAWNALRSARRYARFRALVETQDRQRAVTRWAAIGFLQWFAMPLAGLALLGRIDALWVFPPEFEPVALADSARQGLCYLAMFAGGLAVCVAIGRGVRRLRKRKPMGQPKAARMPDIAAILPRNAAEGRRVALLTANAGLSEEVCFRLYLPLLIVLAGGNALAAFVLAGLVFGMMHRYQGWVGVISTTVVGTILTLTYLTSRGLALPIVMHLAVNATNLVVLPARRGWKPVPGSD